MRKLKAFVAWRARLVLAGLLCFLAALTTGCASVGPAVKTICGICEGVCPTITPLLGAKKKALPKCEDGKVLRVVNFKAVEKKGVEPIVACR